ncbi:hypothetical protein cyc_01047 [Cyclospora cayetanensis]|uniref:Transmembrane protein n=1 Tax=Cyclospora cayetanensis TaxID=88456 RepID=A0A1D3DAJ6_9EIME|nr:hypothetical protein cyc_01047 [Cyclospora cayetanensis]
MKRTRYRLPLNAAAAGSVLLYLAVAAVVGCQATGPAIQDTTAAVEASGKAAAAEESAAELALSIPDTVYARPLRRLAFGSCFQQPQRWETAPGTEAEGAATAAANQRRESVFAAIRSLKPDGWLWIGDAGYSEGEDVASVQEALRALKELKGWQALREELGFVDGTWDDHDFGMNDGGSNQENIDALQEAFLNFLGVASFSPRRQRKGLYSAHLFPLPQQAQEGKPEEGVRVLILDSRSHRDLHFIPSAAMLTLKPPLSRLCSHIGAGSRLIVHLLGLGHAYRGDILGEDQWTWLRAQLKHSKARVHILVSSIQGGVVELTSSGMTHSVGESLLTFSVLTPMLKWLYPTRLRSDAFSLKRNFGVVDISYPETQDFPIKVTASSRDADTGETLLEEVLEFPQTESPEKWHLLTDSVPTVVGPPNLLQRLLQLFVFLVLLVLLLSPLLLFPKVRKALHTLCPPRAKERQAYQPLVSEQAQHSPPTSGKSKRRSTGNRRTGRSPVELVSF